MPGEHGRVRDLRGLQPAAIPRCQCSYVSMISLAVSDFAVKDRDWCRESVLFPAECRQQSAGEASETRDYCS
jgi:hypothetical protein